MDSYKSTPSAKASVDAQPKDKQEQAAVIVDSLEALGYEPDDELATETGAQSSKSLGRRWFTGKFTQRGPYFSNTEYVPAKVRLVKVRGR